MKIFKGYISLGILMCMVLFLNSCGGTQGSDYASIICYDAGKIIYKATHIKDLWFYESGIISFKEEGKKILIRGACVIEKGEL